MPDTAPEKPSVQQTLEAIELFFSPAIAQRNHGGYIAHKLGAANDEERVRLLFRAAKFLDALHKAVEFEQSTQNRAHSYDSSLLLGLYKLLDFLVLEGIYPSIPPGVGLLAEKRAKSLFYSKNDASYRPLNGQDVVAVMLEDVFDPILKDFDLGIEPLIRHRILADLVTANACVAHLNARSGFPSHFATYLDRLPTATLFTSYTSLLQVSKADWFRLMISEQLSLLPLRPNGVRSTVDFLAASHRQPQAQQDQDGPTVSSGPTIPLEALQQASKLLSSVPRSMTSTEYFSRISPQLLAMLDDRSEPAMMKAAAYIIGNGILGKRSIGSPGSIGWTLFVIPIMGTLNPSTPATHLTGQGRSGGLIGMNEGEVLVPQVELELALGRLSALVLSYPNSGLTGRLLRPLLLPLWALANYQGTSYIATETSKLSFKLLSHFLRLVGTPAQIILLSDYISFDGPAEWRLGSTLSGEVCIRRRNPAKLGLSDEENVERQLSLSDARIQALCRLMTASQTSDESVCTLFTHVFEQQNSPKQTLQDEHHLDTLLRRLLATKLLQTLVEKFSDQLLNKSSEVLKLVDQVFKDFLQRLEANHQNVSIKPTLSGLAHITQAGQSQKSGQEATSDMEDSLAVALSLLNALAVGAEDKREEAQVHLKTIQSTLQAISRILENDQPLTLQVATTLAILDSTSQSHSSSAMDTEAVIDVHNALFLITADIANDLPPIRRSALHALLALIKSPDAPLDIPPLALMLLDVIRTDKEEFVYLAAVQTSVQLAIRRNLGYVARLFVDAFQDIEERTGFDGRLRVGEALSTLVDELADAAPAAQRGDIVRKMCDSLLEVASRRGQRQREEIERQRAARLQRRKQREAERAWGGEVPELPSPEEVHEEVAKLSLVEKQKRAAEVEVLESIVKGWEDTGYEEDIRIRGSALSITGRLLESCFSDFRASERISSVIALCLSILSLELTPAKAILRRAAALSIFGILKGINAQFESGVSSSDSQPLMNGEDWGSVEKVLAWVVDTDPDDLTVGHAEAVLEGLEAVRMKVLANAVKSASQPMDLGSQLRGLDIEVQQQQRHSQTRMQQKKGPVIEEIE